MQEVLGKIGFDLGPLGDDLELRAGQLVALGIHHGAKGFRQGVPLLR